MSVYFDYAATHPTEKEIIEKSFLYTGNPSSPHGCGIDARKALENVRLALAKALGCTGEEVYFTSGATESNNTAIFGVCKAKKRFSTRIVTDDSQHPSVSEPIKALEQEGWEVVRVSTKNGVHDEAELREAFSRPVALASFMSVNNETGAKYDIKKIKKLIDISGCGAHLHLDAVQGFAKCDSVSEYRLCDSISVSAHKIGGFKGTGALVIKKNAKIKPLIVGGGQEKGFRSGTENLNGILSFGEALKLYDAKKLPEKYSQTLSALKEVPYLEFNLPESRCSHIISCVARGIRSETLINFLSANGVYCSASSACSTRAKGNTVLEAFGVKSEDIIYALRISISPKTTTEDILTLKDALLLGGERLLK